MEPTNRSTGPYAAMRRAIPRRRFLRGAGVALGLPFLDAMCPVFAEKSDAAETPRRMLAICNNLGFLAGGFFPKQAGKDYELSPYLNELHPLRNEFTVFSGVSHPDVDGSHSSEVCFLTAAPHPSNGGFRNSISLDQYMADRIGIKTRFPSLTLGVNVNPGQRSLTWTGAGVMIPCEDSASAVYRRLFLQGSKQEVEQQMRRLKLGQSIMDAVAGDASTLKNLLGNADRERLDQYMTGVRELEHRMALSSEWERKPKPKASEPEPKDPDSNRAYMEKVRLMYDMSRLAFESDSTRLVTIFLDSVNSPAIDLEGVRITDGYHNLSHHGQNPVKLSELAAIDAWHMKLLAGLLSKLKTTGENGDSLLDRTMVLFGSNFGDANKHTTNNMPVLLAGGGFRHGQHLAFDQERNYPLPNLFVSMLQRIGIESDKFASSTGTMRGLEMKA
jgi:Protein of unknown function (DUF1552)